MVARVRARLFSDSDNIGSIDGSIANLMTLVVARRFRLEQVRLIDGLPLLLLLHAIAL